MLCCSITILPLYDAHWRAKMSYNMFYTQNESIVKEGLGGRKKKGFLECVSRTSRQAAGLNVLARLPLIRCRGWLKTYRSSTIRYKKTDWPTFDLLFVVARLLLSLRLLHNKLAALTTNDVMNFQNECRVIRRRWFHRPSKID